MHGVEMNTSIEKISTNTIFGYDRYLYSVNEKLREAGVDFYGGLSEMTEAEFWHLVGRTTDSNRAKIKEIFRTFPPNFRN